MMSFSEVRFEYVFRDDKGLAQTRYVHLMMKRGERGKPLVTLTMPPSDRRVVQFDFLYPADLSRHRF